MGILSGATDRVVATADSTGEKVKALRSDRQGLIAVSL